MVAGNWPSRTGYQSVPCGFKVERNWREGALQYSLLRCCCVGPRLSFWSATTIFFFQNSRGCLKHVFWRTLFRQNSRCSLSSGEFAWVVGTMQNPTANKSPYHSDARTVSDRLRANKSKCHLMVSTCCELDSLLTYRSIERQRGNSVVTLISLRPIGVCWKKNSARNQREVRSDCLMPQVQERPF